jgi:hypothetical protein
MGAYSDAATSQGISGVFFEMMKSVLISDHYCIRLFLQISHSIKRTVSLGVLEFSHSKHRTSETGETSFSALLGLWNGFALEWLAV